MGYSKRAYQGIGWNSVVKILMTLMGAGKIFLLARLLAPADFGVFALVVVALGLVESATETGINATIVQSKRSVSYFLDTAWVISIARGLVISLAMVSMGYVMQFVYHDQQLFFLIGFASLVPFIRGFINPAIVSLQKNLQFFRDSLYRFVLLAVEVVASVIFCFIFRSVTGLVVGLIFAALFEVLITFLFFSEKPRFHYLKSRAEEIFRNTKGLSISAVLGYIVENIDDIIIGKVVGTSGLGMYHNAYAVSHKLNHQFAKSVQHGTFPVYAKILKEENLEKSRLARAFWKTLGVSMGFFILVAVPFFLFPELSIRILLGEKWLEAASVLRVLIIAGIIQSVVSISTALLIARKQYAWLNANLLVNAVVMIPLIIFLGQRYGLQGAAFALLLSRIVSLPITLIGVKRALIE